MEYGPELIGTIKPQKGGCIVDDMIPETINDAMFKWLTEHDKDGCIHITTKFNVNASKLVSSAESD